MISLTSLAAFFKKFLWLVPFILLATILAALSLFRLLPKAPSVNIIEAPNIQPVAKITSTFTTTNLSLPQNNTPRLAIYNQSSLESFLGKASQIALRAGFNEPPQKVSDIDFGEGITYSNDKGVLNVFADTIQLVKNVQKPDGQKLAVSDLEKIASDFLGNLGFNTSFADSKITYIKTTGDNTFETSNAADADYVNFSFNPEIATFPVVSSGHTNNISVDFYGNVLHLTLREVFLGPKGEEYPVLSAQEAASALLAGQGTIIYLSGPDNFLAQSPTVSISNMYLAYYQPKNIQEAIQPVWVFGGEGEDQNFPVKIKFTYAVPAIKNQYFAK